MGGQEGRREGREGVVWWAQTELTPRELSFFLDSGRAAGEPYIAAHSGTWVPRTCRPQEPASPPRGPARATWASVLPRATLSQPLAAPPTTHLPRPAWPAHAPFPLCLVCRFRFPPLNTRLLALVTITTTPRLSSHFRFFNLPVHRRPIAHPQYVLFLTLLLNIAIAYIQDDFHLFTCQSTRLHWTGLATTHWTTHNWK